MDVEGWVLLLSNLHIEYILNFLDCTGAHGGGAGVVYGWSVPNIPVSGDQSSDPSPRCRDTFHRRVNGELSRIWWTGNHVYDIKGMHSSSVLGFVKHWNRQR